MNLFIKSIVVLSLIVFVAGALNFHWFFVKESMPVEECFSVDCIYSSPKIAVVQGFWNNLLSVLVVVALLFIATSSFFDASTNGLAKALGRLAVFKNWFDNFCYKFYSWLKILEKRDPDAALIVARSFGY